MLTPDERKKLEDIKTSFNKGVNGLIKHYESTPENVDSDKEKLHEAVGEFWDTQDPPDVPYGRVEQLHKMIDGTTERDEDWDAFMEWIQSTDEDIKERQMERIAELVKQGNTSGREADFAWDLTINQL